MFPYTKPEEDPKYFNGYGVKLMYNNSPKNSYCNSILQLLININRKLAYELFVEIFDYDSDDSILQQLKEVLRQIAQVFEDNKERLSELLESDFGHQKKTGKKQDKSSPSESPAKTFINTASLVKEIESSKFKN